MKYFIEKLIENAKNYPNRMSLVTVTEKRITYAELDELSGKVYAYLKEKNISKEDFILICLPHSAMAIITMIGIWKAGAAFAIVENNRAPERIDFIKKDCSCKLVVDYSVFEDMMNKDPLSGYEKIDEHNACYAIYTSGSTGTPKGIIHEYGKLAQMIEASDGTMSYCASDDTTRFALVTPLDFAATVTELVPRFYRTHCIYVASMETVKNKVEFESFFYRNKITDTAMSASLLRTYKNISPYLKTILCTGEASNGLYLENVRLINKYAMSESLFTVATFLIDKKYKITPAGKKCLNGIDILILDENDSVLPNGNVGEICFKNEYFRGYINLPEQSKKVMRNGIFHSGDMGYIDENLNLIVSGRKDDMIKINGNRIEPAEIEANIKSILKINNVIAKGFSDEEHSYIVLYYLNSEGKEIFGKINVDGLRKELSKNLPYYMIPTYYIGLDSFPINQNGKINKKELPKPNVDKMRSTYEAPVSAMEKILCEKIGKVLKVNNVGRNDDFFMLGGDSISAIKLVYECNELNISSQDIYKYRTTYELAKYLDSESSDGVVFNEEKNKKALSQVQHLLPEQIVMIDRLLFAPKTDMWNIPIYMKFKKDTDIIRFKNALMKVIHNHPVFATKFILDDDGYFMQYYDENNYIDIPIIDTTENEFEKIKKEFIKPFPLCNSIFYRGAFYRTETNVYLLMDMHHFICDGTSVTILLNQIHNCYLDSNFNLPIDYYYSYVEYFVNKHKQKEDSKAKEAFDKMYENVKDFDLMQGMLNMDHISGECKSNDIEYDLDIKKDVKHGNVFFITASAIAMAKYNNNNYALLKWTYNSRDTNDKMNMVGALYNNLPIVVKIDKDTSKLEILNNVEKQVELAIENYEYPFAFKNPYQFENTPIVLYQKYTGSFGGLMSLLDEGGILFDKIKDINVICAIDIFESDLKPNLSMKMHYSSSNYDEVSINRYQKYIVKAAHELDRIIK